MKRPIHPASIRHAFSLVELLVVLAILAVIVGMSWPAMQKPWRKSRLRSAAKQLQSELGRARVKAIESSSVLQFRYQSGTGRFAVRPGMTIALASDSQSDSTGDSPVDLSSTNSFSLEDSGGEYLDATEIDELEIEELPSGVIFRDPRESEETREFASDSQAGAADQLPWSKPVCFYPNGRVSGGRFRLADRHGSYVDVTLRGLTGTAKIGRVMRSERSVENDGLEEEAVESDEQESVDSSGETAPAPLQKPAPLKAPEPLTSSDGSGGS